MAKHAALLQGTADSGITVKGCTCGWRPHDAPDPATAFTWHLALADRSDVTAAAPANGPIDLDAAAEDHATRVMASEQGLDGARFTELCSAFVTGARWYRAAEKSETRVVCELFKAAVTALEAGRDHHAELAATAITWARADRIADDRSAELMSCQDAIRSLSPGPELDARRDTLLAKCARAEEAFHRADQLAIACDEALRQAARKLATADAPKEDLP